MGTVTPTNLIMGPGTLYCGVYSETAANEPADSAINIAPAASAGWTDVGGTTDGVNLEVAQEFADLAVDQLVDIPGVRMTKRQVTISTNLAEATLENLALVLNELSSTVASSGNHKVFNPSNNPIGEPNYTAQIFDGFAPSGYRRRVFGRKMLQAGPVQFAYKKDGQTVYTAKFAGYYVSNTVIPYKVVDQIS